MDSVDLVQDDEPVGIVIAVLVKVLQLRAIPRILQVEVCGVPLTGELEGECGLADLARSGQQRHHFWMRYARQPRAPS